MFLKKFRRFAKSKLIVLLICLFINQTILSEGFLAGTLVNIQNSYIPIDQLKVNDFVTSYSFKDKVLTNGKITKIQTKHYKTCIKLTIAGKEIITAPDHKFYCPLNEKYHWLKAKDLKPGDFISSNLTECIRIDNAIELNQEADFYCLTIDKYQNFFVSENNIFVHNFFVTIPLFTWVIGEGLSWVGLSTWLAAAGAVLIGHIANINDIDVSGLTSIGNVKTYYSNNFDPNKINHIINNPDHGFLDSYNVGGPDEDPDEWIKRIKETVDEANKNPSKYPSNRKVDIFTKWKSSDPKYGELIVRLFKVEGMMKLSTAFFRSKKW